MSQESAELIDCIMDVTAENFEEVVMQASFQVPVVLDFWAEWCGPCRTLGPVMEKLAREYGGRFILAKVDSDRNQELAAQFQVRGIPAVKALVGGQVVSEFTGAQPESKVRRFIEDLMPSPAEPLYRQAQDALAAGHYESALERLGQTLAADPGHEMALLDRVELLLEMGRTDEAGSALAVVPDNLEDTPRRDSLRARLELAIGASGVEGDPAQLAARIAADGDDLDARLALAKLLAARNDFEPAMEQLLAVVRRDRKFQDDVGRKTLLNLFHALGSDHDLVRRYRSRLAAVLNV